MRIKIITTGVISAALLGNMLGRPAGATLTDELPSSPKLVEDFSEVSFAVVGFSGDGAGCQRPSVKNALNV